MAVSQEGEGKERRGEGEKKEERKGRKKEGGEEKGEIDIPVGGLDFAFL